MKRTVRQMAADVPSLATVLTGWMGRKRLTQVQVAKASGITRSYISAIANGHVARPSTETLRRLARGLATEPEHLDVHGQTVPARLDQLDYEQALRDLAEAAGLADLTHAPDYGALVREIQALGSNLQAADFWRAIMERHPNPSPTLQQMLKLLADLYDRPGGGDVLSLLLVVGPPLAPDVETLLRRLQCRSDPERH